MSCVWRLSTTPATVGTMALASRSLSDYREDAVFFLSRGLNKGWSKPDWVSVNLTLKCNLACSFCKTCYPVRQELTTREIKDIIKATRQQGRKRRLRRTDQKAEVNEDDATEDEADEQATEMDMVRPMHEFEQLCTTKGSPSPSAKSRV